MKRFLPYILIVLIIVQLFVPFTIGSGVNNNIEIKSNKAEAVESTPAFDEAGYKNAFPDSDLAIRSTYSDESTSLASIDVKIDTGIKEWGDASVNWNHTAGGEGILTGGNVFGKNVFILVVKETKTNKTGWIDISDKILVEIGNYDYTEMRGDKTMATAISTNILINSNNLKPINNLTKLAPGEEYSASLYYKVWNGSSGNGVGYGENIPTVSDGTNKDYIKIVSSTFISASQEIQQTGGTGTSDLYSGKNIVQAGALDGLPVCWGTSPGGNIPYMHVGGCFAQLLYKVIFKPTSYIFALTGRLLDVSVDYSIKDTSYRSPFVVEGWGVVRDFCNMFFIFILLYIAFGTILSLHSVKTKEMIISVVIIGLLINFSLFATQVIIDASNILTRVFYNSQTIKVGPMDQGVIKNQVGSQGEIQLSGALVAKINPQRLILKAGQADGIKTKYDVNLNNDEETDGGKVSTTTFILVTILASIINIVGIITFLMSSLIFIARVIGLWMAMIFAPLAFFTYTVPAMQNWEMVGWKKWWPETIKLAFLAPVFVFFMYLIIKFLETGLGIFTNENATGLDFILGIFVPFIFIMVLLWKAKDIAKSMSGKIGQSITEGLSKVGGVALGAGIGGLAMAGKQTVGRLATNMSQSNTMRDWAGRSKIGASALKMTSGVASKSFDFRATKLGGMAGKELGADLGKAKSGGFAKAREDKIHAEEEFSKKLLDTSGYGMAKLRSGNISDKSANAVISQMQKAGGSNADFVKDKNGNLLTPSMLRTKLVTDQKAAQAVADQMSSTRRNDRARNLTQGINRISVTNMMAANKIRKDPAALAKARDSAGVLKQISDELKKSQGGEHKKEEHKAPAGGHKETAHTEEKHDDHGDGHEDKH